METENPIKNIVLYWLRFFLAMMVSFALFRLVFMLFYFKQTFQSHPGESFWAFWYALRLDASAAAHCLPITLLIIPFAWGKKKNVAISILRIWFVFLYILFAMMAAGDILVQGEWGSKLHYTAIEHLQHPSEAARTGTGEHFIIFFGTLIFLSIFIVPLTNWIHNPFKKISEPTHKPYYLLSITSLVVAGICFVVARGGFQAIAINVSQSYYSPHQILNNAAVNTPWSVLQSVVEGVNTMNGNPYVFHKSEDLQTLAKPLFDGNAPYQGNFLRTNKPNIVLVVLESWSANAMHYEENGKSPTPYFKQMMDEGWYWSNAYTVGWKSDFGVPGILSAWPCHDLGSICSHPSKCRALPGIAKSLKEKGYSTEFIYGGQLVYGNIKSYVYQTGYDHVIESENLPLSLPTGRLGVHDDELFQYAISKMNAEKSAPFFKVVYTLSSHPPFDHPNNKHTFNGAEEFYLNSLEYSDMSVKHFIDEAKKQPWFANTLFIFSADHGRAVPGFDIGYEPDFFRIPILFWGPALDTSFAGKKYTHISSQTDIVPTLLQELDVKTEEYPFGRNVFHPEKQHKAFVMFCGGFFVVSDVGTYGYDLRAKMAKDYPMDPIEKQKLATEGEAYLQFIMEEYLRR